MTEKTQSEHELLAAIAKLATIAKILWAILVLIVGGTTAGVMWVTNVDNRLTHVEDTIGEVKTALVDDLLVRMRSVEESLAVGVLPVSLRLHTETDKTIEKMRERLRALETKR